MHARLYTVSLPAEGMASDCHRAQILHKVIANSIINMVTVSCKASIRHQPLTIECGRGNLGGIDGFLISEGCPVYFFTGRQLIFSLIMEDKGFIHKLLVFRNRMLQLARCPVRLLYSGFGNCQSSHSYLNEPIPKHHNDTGTAGC